MSAPMNQSEQGFSERQIHVQVLVLQFCLEVLLLALVIFSEVEKIIF